MSAEVSTSPVAPEQDPEVPETSVKGADGDTAPAEATSNANEVAAAAQIQPAVAVDEEQAESADATAPADTTTTDDANNTIVVALDSTPSSSKKSKNKKRRSSTGIPEHKNKKTNPRKKEPELQLDAEAGDLFLANMKGFPKWPSIICDDEMLPETLLQNRPVTARRPDGSYREDFREGGKNVRDRTYPIMYLGTYEFSWLQNTFLTPLTMEEAKTANKTKMSKSLTRAFEEAGEGHDLDHFKSTLLEFQKKQEEAIEAAEKKAAEAEAKKAKKGKKKAAEAGDEDEEMPDADMEPPKSSSKKRKATEDKEGSDQKKVKLSLSKGSKTPKSEASEKKTPKTKTPKNQPKAQPVEPEISEAKRREKKNQATLYCRHKLQKAFLTSEVPPKEQEMSQMASFFDQLEKADDIDAGILRNTKIHKVMKGIVKLSNIPKDEEFHFKDRSAALLETWTKLLEESTEKPRPSTANGEKEGEPEAKSEEKKEEEEATKEDGVAEKVGEVDEGKDAAGDIVMSDADAVNGKDEKPAEDIVADADVADEGGELETVEAKAEVAAA